MSEVLHPKFETKLDQEYWECLQHRSCSMYLCIFIKLLRCMHGLFSWLYGVWVVYEIFTFYNYSVDYAWVYLVYVLFYLFLLLPPSPLQPSLARVIFPDFLNSHADLLTEETRVFAERRSFYIQYWEISQLFDVCCSIFANPSENVLVFSFLLLSFEDSLYIWIVNSYLFILWMDN